MEEIRSSPPTSNLGLSSRTLAEIEAQLRGVHITREFHAFCHLCPSDSPAASVLASLDQAALLQWGHECKNAIDLWSCCTHDAGVNSDAPSITTSRSATLALRVKVRDGACVVTQRNVRLRHACHIFPYCLGKSHNDPELPLWRVLRLFWGEENRMKLKQTIFGPETLVAPNSRTNINQLYNMITLSSEIHGHWGLGNFMLEPVDEATNSYEQNLRFKWVPQRRSSGSINLLTNPNSLLDVLEAEPEMLFNCRTGTRIDDGCMISVTTRDPISYPLPDRDLLRLQCNLIMVMRMAGRAGSDTLESYDSDSEVPSIATADVSRRNSSTDLLTQISSDRVIPASAPSRKTSNPFLSKMEHLKDRICGVIKLERPKSARLRVRLSSSWNDVRRAMRRHV